MRTSTELAAERTFLETDGNPDTDTREWCEDCEDYIEGPVFWVPEGEPVVIGGKVERFHAPKCERHSQGGEETA